MSRRQERNIQGNPDTFPHVVTHVVSLPDPVILLLQCPAPVLSAELLPECLFWENNSFPRLKWNDFKSDLWHKQKKMSFTIFPEVPHPRPTNSNCTINGCQRKRGMNGWVSKQMDGRCFSSWLKLSFRRIWYYHKFYFLPSKSVCQLEVFCSCSMSVCFKEKPREQIAEGRNPVVFSLINPVIISIAFQTKVREFPGTLILL